MDRRSLCSALGGVAVTALLLTGCGSSAAGGTATSPTSLTITAQAGPDAAAQTWTLTCDPAGGTHPDSQAACAALAAAKDPFAPVRKDVACTEIYGGPQTATVVGTYRGEQVSATYSRTDGCQIARWDAIAPVLVVEGGV
jgi:hypothetical protein